MKSVYALMVFKVFLGKLPEDLYEDELIPLMEKCGKIYELRVIVDKEGYNRGFGFVTFCDKESAKKAVNIYSGYRLMHVLNCTSLIQAPKGIGHICGSHVSSHCRVCILL